MPSERVDASAASAWAIEELPPGAVIAGRYRIEHTLGSGGMGVVLAAQHITLGQRVAIKFMLPEASKDAAAVGRFTREALAASRINSEYVTRVFDLGELPSGAPFIVMEYLEGSDLAQRLRDRDKLPIPEAIEFALQTCEALAEAHALGIVHRDLKPSNLFCVERSDGLASIKVLDFGISKFTRAEQVAGDLSLTSTKSIIGSPFYMSPEQMGSAKNADVRADIWALGVMLYEMLAGALPFEADTLPELAVRIATQPPKPLHVLQPELPRALSNVVARCLEKERDQRPRDIAELARALAPFGPARAREHAERATRVLERANTAKRAALPAADGGQARSTLALTRRRTALIAGIAVAASAAVGVWLFNASQQTVEGPLVRPAPVPGTAQAVSASTDAPPPSAPSATVHEASADSTAQAPTNVRSDSERARPGVPPPASVAAPPHAEPPTRAPAATPNISTARTQETHDERQRVTPPLQRESARDPNSPADNVEAPRTPRENAAAARPAARPQPEREPATTAAPNDELGGRL